MIEKCFTKEEIEKQMRANHCTRDEAIDILAWDYDIDHGDKEKGAMTAEQKKMVRSLTKADKSPAEKRTVKRERKVDENKAEIFGWVKTMLEGMELNGKIENMTCKNEAEISFIHAGEEFSIKFTKHRKPKAWEPASRFSFFAKKTLDFQASRWRAPVRRFCQEPTLAIFFTIFGNTNPGFIFPKTVDIIFYSSII